MDKDQIREMVNVGLVFLATGNIDMKEEGSQRVIEFLFGYADAKGWKIENDDVPAIYYPMMLVNITLYHPKYFQVTAARARNFFGCHPEKDYGIDFGAIEGKDEGKA